MSMTTISHRAKIRLVQAHRFVHLQGRDNESSDTFSLFFSGSDWIIAPSRSLVIVTMIEIGRVGLTDGEMEIVHMPSFNGRGQKNCLLSVMSCRGVEQLFQRRLPLRPHRHAHPHEDSWETSDFHFMQLAPDHYLLTYTLLQGERITRRMTIWRRAADGWKIVYHQGTTVESD